MTAPAFIDFAAINAAIEQIQAIADSNEHATPLAMLQMVAVDIPAFHMLLSSVAPAIQSGDETERLNATAGMMFALGVLAARAADRAGGDETGGAS